MIQAGKSSTWWPIPTCPKAVKPITTKVARAGQPATGHCSRRPSRKDRPADSTSTSMASSWAVLWPNTGTGNAPDSSAGVARVTSSSQARHQNTKP